MSSGSKLTRLFVIVFGLTFALGLSAGALPVSAYSVSYGINMTPGTTNGNDITNVFIFRTNGDARERRLWIRHPRAPACRTSLHQLVARHISP
jgi:hypothetical protein